MADKSNDTPRGKAGKQVQPFAGIPPIPAGFLPALVALVALVLHYLSPTFHVKPWTPWVRVNLTLTYVFVIVVCAVWAGRWFGFW